MFRYIHGLLYIVVIASTGFLWLHGIRGAIGETTPAPNQYRFPPEELISRTLWAAPLKTFHKLLKIHPDAAGTELQNVSQKLFNGHTLAEEWVPLYLRLNRHGTEHPSDLVRVSELEIRMLTDIDPKRHAEHIRQHQASIEHHKSAESYIEFFNNLSPESKSAMGKVTDRHVETLNRQLSESEKKIMKMRKTHAIRTVKHLQTLSVEEQRDYLKKRKAWQANRPARKRLEAKFPGSTDELWNQELQDLIEAGYTLPENVDFTP